MMNDPSSESLVVSLQHLTLCNGSFYGDVQPWKGHYKPTYCRQVRRPPPDNQQVNDDGINDQSDVGQNELLLAELSENLPNTV